MSVLCLEVHRNGKRLSRAGLRKGVVSAHWSWVSRDDARPVDDLAAGQVVQGLECRVGGLDTAKPNRDEFIDWIVLDDVRLGDEFMVRVTRAARADKPAERRRSDVESSTRKGIKSTRCSFCSLQRPVERSSGSPEFMRGIDVVICRNCVGVAHTMVERGVDEALHFKAVIDGHCSFCVRHRAKVLAADKVGVCLRCLKSISQGF
jgi:hypothetical protein